MKVESLRSLLSGSSFLRHVLAVSGSTLLVQIISLIVAPINTRLYSPDEYGLMAVFGASFSVLSILATMRYEGAIPLEQKDLESANVLMLCFLLVIFWSALATVVVICFGHEFASWMSSDGRFEKYLWFLPLGLFATSIFNVLSSWAVKEHQFRMLSVIKIRQSIFGSGTTIVLGLLNFGTIGMIFGSLVSSGNGVFKLLSTAMAKMKPSLGGVSLDGIWRAAKSHYRFPLFNSPALLLNSFSVQMPILLMTSGFGAASTGYFAICQRILLLPTLLVSGAITPVFYSRAKKAHDEGTLREFCKKILESIAGLNASFMVFLAIFGETAFSVAFGAEWSRSGIYAAALAPWLLLNFLVTPIASIPLVFHRQGMDLVFQVGLLLVRAISLYMGIYFRSDLVAMFLFGGASALFMLVYMGWLLRLVALPITPLLLKVAKEVALAILIFGSCRLVMLWANGSLLVAGIVLMPAFAFFAKRALDKFRKLK